MTAAAPSRREAFLDASRGLAMVCVMIAHFGWIYSTLHPAAVFRLLSTVMMFAAPTFMLVSGMLLGTIFVLRGPAEFRAFSVKLADRGLFLLTVGHVVIALPYLAYAGGWQGAMRSGQILDAIGCAVVLGPFVIRRTSPAARLALAMVLLGLTWAFVATPAPAWGPARLVKDTLIGGAGWWLYNFPVIPWLALYLVGTVVGQRVAPLLSAGRHDEVLRFLLTRGVVCAAAGAALGALGPEVSGPGFGAIAPGQWLPQVLSIARKVPPSPVFFLFWGGLALTLVACVLALHQRGKAGGLLSLAALVGRNSLFLFLLQEQIYVGLVWMAKPPDAWYWPLVLVGTIAAGVVATVLWDRSGLARLLTVGYGRWWGPVTGRALSA